MELEIDWREPPLNGEALLRATLKKHPGRWARVKKGLASSTASSAWRKQGFTTEVHPAESDPKKYDIYARWPESSTPATRAAAGLPTPAPTPPTSETVEPAAPSKTKVQPTQADDGTHVSPSANPAGGYMASRARRAVPTDGTTTIRPAGHHPSPVRP